MARSITSIPARETITSEGNSANIPKKRVAAYCRVSTDEDGQFLKIQHGAFEEGLNKVE